MRQSSIVACWECDAPERIEALRALAGDQIDFRTAACLSRCSYADVVVIRPSPHGRSLGGRPVWFGFVDDYAVGRLRQWLADGGPGVAALPDDLALQQIDRPIPGASAERRVPAAERITRKW